MSMQTHALSGGEAYSREYRQKVREVAEHTHPLQGPWEPSVSAEGVIVLCLVRDGAYYLDAFVEHHLAMGVQHIVFMDNGSRDNTLEIAAERASVTVLRCTLPFASHKLAMRTFLAERFGARRWCLSVDIDELWEHPYRAQLSLTTFIRYLEAFGFTACAAHQLDLFAHGDITISGGSDESIRDLRYYDLSDVVSWRPGAPHADACPDERVARFYHGNVVSPAISVMARGVRWRLFGITPVLTKVPLFKFVPSVAPFAVSSHRLEGACLADVSCLLRHLSLNRMLYSKAVRCIREGSYYSGSAHYRRIAEVIASGPVKLPIPSERIESVDDLIDRDFIHVSSSLDGWVERYSRLGEMPRTERW